MMQSFMDSLNDEEKMDMMKLMMPIMMKSMTSQMMAEMTKNMSPEMKQKCEETMANCLETLKQTK